MSDVQIDISMLVCTYNRAADVRELLQTAVAQQTNNEFEYEIIVVDNNSTDETRRVVEDFVNDGHSRVRYLFEPQAGKSHALMRGLKEVRGWAYTITDDDFILPPEWLRRVVTAFRQYPDAAAVSGKVLPKWSVPPPAWLTPEHWSPIAMADYGDQSFYADLDNPICLLACAFRLQDVLAVGGYRTDLGVSARQTIGGTEDADILMRLWKANRRALYLPDIFLWHKVGAERAAKSYHRRWHTGHGSQYAVMRDEDFERSSKRLFGVPAHLYRQTLNELAAWTKARVRGNQSAAFRHEARLRFFYGFFRTRLQDHRNAKK